MAYNPPHKKIKGKIMEENTKGIKTFLQVAKAVSPAILALILITVAAAGTEMTSHGNVKYMGQNLTVKGTLNITGSTTILPVTEAAKVEFNKEYPA